MITPDAAVQHVDAAIDDRDQAAYQAALLELAEAVQSAAPEQIEPALDRLVPLLREVPLGPAADLAKIAGSMVGMAGVVADTGPALDVLVERACQAMEQAAQFLAHYPASFGEPPAPEEKDAYAIRDTIFRFVRELEDRLDDPYPLVEAWFAGSDWVQPVLYLSQRADVRAALPQRERLLAAAAGIREQFSVAEWLYGLLLVLDDAPLVVLHRPTGRGYRVTIGGIGGNFQLHTLLAARLIGDTEGGWLPGTPPTAEMTAAADGTGEPEVAGGITGQFNLVDPYGAWIWNEGRPADIPLFEGERVVILDPAPYPRSWKAGRIYPLMQPTLRVDAQLPAQEAASRLAKASPASATGTPGAGTPGAGTPGGGAASGDDE